MSSVANQDRKIIIKNIAMTVLFLFIFGAIGLGLGQYFNEQIVTIAEAIVTSIGAWALWGMVFFTDLIVSPMTPDVVFFIIANSSLRDDWFYHVTAVGIASILAGHMGWYIGTQLNHWPRAKRFFENMSQENRDFIRRHGHWAVVLGALTPFPFSITCWSAGFFKVTWRRFAIAAMFRLPRIYVYYLAIHYAAQS